MTAPFEMVGDAGAVCVDGVCALPEQPEPAETQAR